MTARGQVFLDALGDDAERLHPVIRAQMAVSEDESAVEGVFAVAGSRFGRWNALARPVVGRRMLVTRLARDVSFELRTRAGHTAGGRATLDTTREFHFRDGTQFIVDRLTGTPHPGLVHNLLGEQGRVEMLERCEVTAEGFLRMITHRVAIRVAGRRLELRGPLRIDVDLVDGWDEKRQRRTISMSARSPLVGTILEYRGWYRHVDGAGAATGQ